MEERRRDGGYVTHRELREALAPIFERHREVDEALRFYERMVPLGLQELLPVMLADANVRRVVSGLRSRYWRWWLGAIAILGGAGALVAVIGGTIAILRTLHLIE